LFLVTVINISPTSNTLQNPTGISVQTSLRQILPVFMNIFATFASSHVCHK